MFIGWPFEVGVALGVRTGELLLSDAHPWLETVTEKLLGDNA